MEETVGREEAGGGGGRRGEGGERKGSGGTAGWPASALAAAITTAERAEEYTP